MNMKKLILLAMIFFCFLNVYSQIKTPKNSFVTAYDVYNLVSQDSLNALRYADSILIVNQSFNAKIIGGADNRYNCHYYAWYLSENEDDTRRVWLRPVDDGVNLFLENTSTNPNGDNSYRKSSYLSTADKIIIGEQNIDGNHEWHGDHSMTHLDDPDNAGRDWVSKWGPGALVQHGKYSHPYHRPDSLYHYYSYWVSSMVDYGPNPTTNIPNTICGRTQQTFNVTHGPHLFLVRANETTLGGNKLSGLDVDGINKTVTFTPTGYGTCTIQLRFETGAGFVRLLNVTFNLGMNPDPILQGPTCMCAWESYYIAGSNRSLDYDWSFMYGTYNYYTYPYSIMVTPYMDGGYIYLTTTTTDICTREKITEVFYPSCGICPEYYIVYPNPSNSSDIIYIETTKEALDMVDRAKDIMENLSAVEATNIKLPNLEDYAYQLINKMGEVKMNGKALGGKVILNVSNLTPGVYYVIIDSGTKPETHELIIN